VKVQINYRSMSTSQGIKRSGDIVDLPQAEIDQILEFKPGTLIVVEEAVFTSSKPKAKKRARNANGTLKADDPSTPDVNEAWEDG